MKYPLIALPLSTLLVLTGCGGSGSGGDDKPNTPPPPAPTVSVTAPANAIATIAFEVQWTSTDAASCSTDFSKDSTTSGTAEVTEDEAGSKTYTVTCTGAGGSASGSANVEVSPVPSPQGLWKGTANDGTLDRTFGGVVTAENQYWLVYNGVGGNANTPAGFLVGTGNVGITDVTNGTLSAGDLIEFNFEGKGSAVGSLAATFAVKETLEGTTTTSLSNMSGVQGYEIDGVTGADGIPGVVLVSNPTPVTFNDGGTPLDIVPNVNDPTGIPGISGQFRFADYGIEMTIPLDPDNPSVVKIDYKGRVLNIVPGPDFQVTFDDSNPQPTLLLTGVLFEETTTEPVDCQDNGGGLYCAFVPTSTPFGDILITFDDSTLASYTGVAHAFQPVDALGPNPDGTCINDQYSVAADPGAANTVACANATLTFSGTIPSGSSSEVTQNFTTAYNAAYDTAADLTVLAGSYIGNAGVGASIEALSSLNVAADGTISGLTAATDCAISGTVVPHGDKNVYDAELTFTDNGSTTCTLDDETLSGVVTYDAATGTITVTAVDSSKSKGFLFVGTHPVI